MVRRCIMCNRHFDDKNYISAGTCSEQCDVARYWLNMVRRKDDPESVRCDGVQYMIDRSCLQTKVRREKTVAVNFFGGLFGGRTEMLHRYELLKNAEIPEGYRHILKDNATIDWPVDEPGSSVKNESEEEQ